MRKIIAIAVVFWVAVFAYNATPQKPPAPTETFGERAKRICVVEAGKSKRDQNDCVTMKLFSKAAEIHGADYDRRLRDAAH